MPKLEAALVVEQGVRFAVVAVKNHIVNSQYESEKAIRQLTSIFPGYNIVVMGMKSGGQSIYRGRKDIVNFLANVSPNRLPWKSYSVGGV